MTLARMSRCSDSAKSLLSWLLSTLVENSLFAFSELKTSLRIRKKRQLRAKAFSSIKSIRPISSGY